IEAREVDSIVDWISEKRRRRTRCCITTPASNAVRIAGTAWKRGISLEGTFFVLSGEPYTPAKQAILERVGATGASRYAYGGSINIGFGCAQRLEPDDLHVNEHLLALILHPHAPADAPVRPLLCTTVDPLAPRLLLNVQNGDYANMTRRACGCALGRSGLTLHLDNIRSYEKFTAEGMNYSGEALFELVEETLPGQFGGGPGDYQLVEEEDADGQTVLSLVVRPELGPLDHERLLQVLQAALSRRSRGNRFMAGVWKDAGIIRIRRAAPYASPRGKILPLHIRRSSAQARTDQRTLTTETTQFTKVE
ncbi:MAG TPA: hypothetical protein VNO43_07850, partial [Candidatus Eisenbacteria bacterium]|nr:hypothetical protein [Candidatus Eisenbacteria bacterium]